MLYIIAGTRPNFVKIAPLIWEFTKRRVDYRLIHTGQHYDYSMNRIFFKQLNIPEPDYKLDVGSGTHAYQTGMMMIGIEKCCLVDHPEKMIVVGDGNCTLAGALAGAKLHIPVAHVEAGLRSGDMGMPEEVNRILIDHISDWLFVTEIAGLANLANEGIEMGVHYVGNILTDTMEAKRSEFVKTDGKYALATIHRPKNVDDADNLARIFEVFNTIADQIKIIFPIHPRTREKIQNSDINPHQNIHIADPMGYIDFMSHLNSCTVVLTDSGGIQEESTYLGIPCLTLRENTERPVTVAVGTNTICGVNKGIVLRCLNQILNGGYKTGEIPELWDGHVAGRIAEVLS